LGHGIASTVAFFCVLGGDAAFPRAGAFKMIAELLNILEELKRKTGTK